MSKRRLLIDKDYIVILDFILGIAYMFFVNFYSHINHAVVIDRILSIMIAVCFLMFLGILLHSLIASSKKRVFLLSYTGLIILVYGINYLCFPENNDAFGKNFNSFVLNIFRLSSLLYIIDDYKRLMKWLANYSLLISLFLLYQFFLNGLVFNNGIYSMALGYISLLPTMILISTYLTEKRIVFLIGGIINFLIILSYASRGPLLCLALFLAFSLLRNAKPYVIIMFVLVAAGFYIFYDDIIRFVLQILPSSQSSRTLMYLVQNRALDDSGRGGMYQRLLLEIGRRPFDIRGINADYQLLGVYSHNIILELLYEFGILLGGVIIIDIVNKAVVTYVNSHKHEMWQLCFIFMMIAITELLVSNTLWREWTFWAWIVLFIKCGGNGLLKFIHITTRKI